MGSEVFELADDISYLLQRLALQRRSTVEAVLADLIRAEGDRTLPGVLGSYHRRAQTAERILRLRGIDPADGDYQQAASAARALLDQVDALDIKRSRRGPDQARPASHVDPPT